MIQLSRPAGLKGIASALLLVALLGLQARIASAVPTFTPDTIGIDGQVSFRIAPGAPVVSIPFFFLASDQTVLQVEEIFPVGVPPGLGLYRLFSRAALTVIGASIVLQGKFDAECIASFGCGPIGLNFEINGIVAFDSDRPLRTLQINFDDLLFTGRSLLPGTLAGEIGLIPPAGNEITLKAQEAVSLNPGTPLERSFSQEVTPLTGKASLRARIGIETSGNMDQGETLSSNNTFEIQLTTVGAAGETPAPAPEPAILALVGIGLVGLGWSRRSSRGWRSRRYAGCAI